MMQPSTQPEIEATQKKGVRRRVVLDAFVAGDVVLGGVTWTVRTDSTIVGSE